MKSIIKTGLIALAIIMIVTSLMVFIDPIKPIHLAKIEPVSFVKFMKKQVDQEIKGMSYEKAQTAFDSLNGLVKTESFVAYSDGQHALSENEALDCYKMTFDAYAPIFVDYGNDYFHSDWRKEGLDRIKTESERLQSLRLAESGTDVNDSLLHFIQYEKDYTAAKKVVNNAAYGCETVKKVNEKINNANGFKKKYPLCNNSELRNDLSNVRAKATEKLAKEIISQIDTLIKHKEDYIHLDYQCWANEKEPFEKRLDSFSLNFNKEYNKQYSIKIKNGHKERSLPDAKKDLKNADQDLVRIQKELNSSNGTSLRIEE